MTTSHMLATDPSAVMLAARVEDAKRAIAGMPDPAKRPTFHVLRTCGVCNGTGDGTCLHKCWQCDGLGERIVRVLAHELTDAEHAALSTADQVRADESIAVERHRAALARFIADNDVVRSVTRDAQGRPIETREVPAWESEASAVEGLRQRGLVKYNARTGGLALTDEGRKALARALEKAATAPESAWTAQLSRIAIREPRFSTLPNETPAVVKGRGSRVAAPCKAGGFKSARVED